MANDKLQEEFDLLKKIINPSETVKEVVDLEEIENMIFKRLPETLGQYAPMNFPQLHFEFSKEFERFKEFILYDKLIGKNVVALGGGFSSGKSSFLNSILDMKKDVVKLPSKITPSTSVPAYLVYDEEMSVYAINVFGNRVVLKPEEVKKISHSFGETEGEDVVTLGHVLKSVFIASPKQLFHNIALLDTPGYSKPEGPNHTEKTDENIARAQLNSSNYILWFVDATAGTVGDDDLKFIETLNQSIPILVILNKADSVLAEELEAIRTEVRNKMKRFQVVDVLAYSSKTRTGDYDKKKIIAQLKKWDKQIFDEKTFARNFKVLFTACKDYYSEEIKKEGKRLERLNKLNLEAEFVSNPDVAELLGSLSREIGRNQKILKEKQKLLADMQKQFFTEIKRVGDEVNIHMPVPSELDLIQDKIVDPKRVLDLYCKKKGIKVKNEYAIFLSDMFAEVESRFNQMKGNGEYTDSLKAVLSDSVGSLESKDIVFQYKIEKDVKGIEELVTILSQVVQKGE